MKSLCLPLLFVLLANTGGAQSVDSTSKLLHINGVIGVTNNGISIIPTFSLNAPAAIFNFFIRRNRFSFDPDMRVTLDGKKGGMLFWFRYDFVRSKNFKLGAGIHPAYNLALRTIEENDKMWEITQARRFIAYEVAPSFTLSKYLSIGPYLLRGMGLQKDGPRSTYFLALNTNITRFPIARHVRFSWTPQGYYLNIDGQDGFYLANHFRISHDQFPVALSSIMNKEIKTRIEGSKNFAWNLVLSYSFRHQYSEK